VVAGTQVGVTKAGRGTSAEVVRLGVPVADLCIGALAGFAGPAGGLADGLGVGGGLVKPLGLGVGVGVGPGLGDVLGLGLGLGLVHFCFGFPSRAATFAPWP